MGETQCDIVYLGNHWKLDVYAVLWLSLLVSRR
jgi:hypothetical protein